LAGRVTGTPWAVARGLAHAAASALPAYTLPLADAVGHTLAAPLISSTPLPSFDTVAMDGYAVAGEGPWLVVRQVLAGHGDPGELRPGQAAEVATGAPVPAGADYVLRYEDARRDGDLVGDNPASEDPGGGSGVGGPVGGGAASGRHVRRIGEDVRAGVELLPAGTPVTGAVAGLAASVGLDRLAVRQPARVVALITGDEIVHSGVPGHGRVRDAIGPLLPELITRHGAELKLRLPVPDQPPTELAGAVRAGIATAEVVLVCGATSAGPADRLPAVLAELAAEPVVDGVGCRPGHPQSLWRLPGGRYVVGVPGNPFAALAACHTLLVPLLAALAGRPLPDLPLAPLHASPKPGALTRLVPVRWAGAQVIPVGNDGPGSLWGAAAADALAAVPPDWSGEPVPLLRL
jgi:molybdopterin molybdotransferase